MSVSDANLLSFLKLKLFHHIYTLKFRYSLNPDESAVLCFCVASILKRYFDLGAVMGIENDYFDQNSSGVSQNIFNYFENRRSNLFLQEY